MFDNDAVIQRHGVMVRWQHHGLLICGPPGIGKSSLALAILKQGGQLVADDIVDISRRQNQLIACCPSEIVGQLHSRELGLLDICSLFNTESVLSESQLDVIVELLAEPPKTVSFKPQKFTSLLGLKLPVLTLSINNPLSLPERIDLGLRRQ